MRILRRRYQLTQIYIRVGFSSPTQAPFFLIYPDESAGMGAGTGYLPCIMPRSENYSIREQLVSKVKNCFGGILWGQKDCRTIILNQVQEQMDTLPDCQWKTEMDSIITCETKMTQTKLFECNKKIDDN